MASSAELPDPHSEELVALLGSTTQRLLYGFLHRRRDHPPTMVELRGFVANALDEDQPQTDRRVRELRRHFDIRAERVAGELSDRRREFNERREQFLLRYTYNTARAYWSGLGRSQTGRRSGGRIW